MGVIAIAPSWWFHVDATRTEKNCWYRWYVNGGGPCPHKPRLDGDVKSLSDCFACREQVWLLSKDLCFSSTNDLLDGHVSVRVYLFKDSHDRSTSNKKTCWILLLQGAWHKCPDGSKFVKSGRLRHCRQGACSKELQQARLANSEASGGGKVFRTRRGTPRPSKSSFEFYSFDPIHGGQFELPCADCTWASLQSAPRGARASLPPNAGLLITAKLQRVFNWKTPIASVNIWMHIG